MLPFGSLLAPFWLPFGSLLAPIWLPFSSLLAPFWLPFGYLLAPSFGYIWLHLPIHFKRIFRYFSSLASSCFIHRFHIYYACAQILLGCECQWNSNTLDSVPWTVHPMGKPLLKSIIDHSLKTGDFQTAASILCCFWSLQTRNKLPTGTGSSSSVQSSPTHETSNKLRYAQFGKMKNLLSPKKILWN